MTTTTPRVLLVFPDKSVWKLHCPTHNCNLIPDEEGYESESGVLPGYLYDDEEDIGYITPGAVVCAFVADIEDEEEQEKNNTCRDSWILVQVGKDKQ